MPDKLPIQKVQRFTPGARSLSARHLNSIVDATNRITTGVNLPRQPAISRGGTNVQILTLVAHNGDYLECLDSEANTVYVAKVYELRQTSFDGETIGGVTYTYTSASEREATDGVDTETQFITPAYVVDAEIFAAKVKGDTGVLDPDTNPIEWIELNQGRAWAWDEP